MIATFRHTLRSLRRTPVYTATVVLTLALGIALATSAFSLVDAVLIRPLPFHDAGRIVTLAQSNGTTSGAPVSYPNLRDWRAMDRGGSFVDLAFARGRGTTMHDAQGDHVEFITMVSPGFFSVLRPLLLRGRYFTADEEQQGAHVAVITRQLWRDRFASDPDLLGRTISLDDGDFTIVGIVPGYPSVYPGWTNIYLPANAFLATETALAARDFHADSRAIGRLKPGATIARARTELSAIAARLATTYPAADGSWPDVTVNPLRQELLGNATSNLRLLSVAMALVLLIGWVNVTNLSLVRTGTRMRELAIRSSLGASRWRLAGRIVAEHLLLALAAMVMGGIAASWTLGLVRGFAGGAPGSADVAINLRAWGFAAVAALLTTVVVAALPALRLVHADLGAPLKEGSGAAGTGRRQQLVRSALVIGELALALMLVISAGLLVRSFWRLSNVDPGFDTHGLVAIDFSPPGKRYVEPAQAGAYYGRILAAVQGIAGVSSAALTNHMPLNGASLPTNVEVAGRPPDPEHDPQVLFRTLSPEYLHTLGIRLVKGRNFTDADLTSGTAMLVNESFVRDYFPGVDPIGKAVMLHKSAQGFADLGQPLPGIIVGEIADVHHYGPLVPPYPEIYIPYTRNPWSHMVVVARAANGDAASLIPAMRRAMLSVDSATNTDSGVFGGFAVMDDVLHNDLSGSRFGMLLLGGFAACALLLAAIGVYGLMAYAIAQRTREFGIRLALGADPARVVRLVLGSGARLVAGGIVLGLLGALALTKIVSSMLYGVTARDPLTFAVMTLVLALVASVACYLPARRAARVDPVEVLRE
jgi:putative ABC transport system permease protein